MPKVVLVTFRETQGPLTGSLKVSHGINLDTLETVCLPPEPLSNFNAKLDKDLDAYVIEEN